MPSVAAADKPFPRKSHNVRAATRPRVWANRHETLNNEWTDLAMHWWRAARSLINRSVPGPTNYREERLMLMSDTISWSAWTQSIAVLWETTIDCCQSVCVILGQLRLCCMQYKLILRVVDASKIFDSNEEYWIMQWCSGCHRNATAVSLMATKVFFAKFYNI